MAFIIGIIIPALPGTFGRRGWVRLRWIWGWATRFFRLPRALETPCAELEAPEGAPQGAVDVFFRPDEVAFAPADGAGLAADVKGVAQRGPDVRIDCHVAGEPMELVGHGPTLPPGVAPGLAVRIRPLRPQVYPAD